MEEAGEKEGEEERLVDCPGGEGNLQTLQYSRRTSAYTPPGNYWYYADLLSVSYRASKIGLSLERNIPTRPRDGKTAMSQDTSLSWRGHTIITRNSRRPPTFLHASCRYVSYTLYTSDLRLDRDYIGKVTSTILRELLFSLPVMSAR